MGSDAKLWAAFTVSLKNRTKWNISVTAVATRDIHAIGRIAERNGTKNFPGFNKSNHSP